MSGGGWTCSRCGILLGPNGRTIPGKRVYPWERRPNTYVICRTCEGAKEAPRCVLCGAPTQLSDRFQNIELGDIVCYQCAYTYLT